MKRIVSTLTLSLPSMASAHPGHSHGVLSPYHHLLEVGLWVGIAGLGLLIYRALRAKK